MKKILLLSACLLVVAPAFTQAPPVGTTTVSFKPDATVGEDATIFKLNDFSDKPCTPRGYPQPPADLNFGNDPDLGFSTWTYRDPGCDIGTTRTLIRFTELNTIPSDASIISATLVLRGPVPTNGWGNNFYPSSPLNNTNPGWLKRVLPGIADAWSENAVTWNGQPDTDPNSNNWVKIPVTELRWGWTQHIDVTALVSNIVQELATDPDANNGFLLMLQDEIYYRSQLYASSDYSDVDLWPELVVTYNDCSAAFSYCVSSSNSSAYAFTALSPNMVSYEWTVDGNYAGSGPALNYVFPYNGASSTSHKVCLKSVGTDGYTCERCLDVCGSSYIKHNNSDICHPLFTYCSATNNNHHYTFTANDPSQQSYTWSINGNPAGTGPVFDYLFPTEGDYEIELRVTSSNTSCFSLVKNFCVSPRYIYNSGSAGEGAKPSAKPQTGQMLRGDDPELLMPREQVTISPNPAESGWNIDYFLTEADDITITLSDLSGKQIKSVRVAGSKDGNRYYLPASGMASGMYYAEIKGRQINIRKKVVKK